MLAATAERPRAGPGKARTEPGSGDPGMAYPARPRRRLRLAGDAASLRDARHLVAHALADSPVAPRDVAVLLTGEVVTNAVVHGGGWFLMEVRISSTRVHVEVTDTTADQPRVLSPSDQREHGRGMAIVDAMATRWGADNRGAHKVVWFDVALAG